MKFSKKFVALASASVMAIALPAVSQSAMAEEVKEAKDKAPELGSYGFDSDGMDSSVRPGDDFYGYANGTWLKNNAIPDDKSNYGMFTALDDLSKQRVNMVLEAEKDMADSKAGAAYASYLDEAGVEALGMAPVEPLLNAVRAIDSRKAYLAYAPVAARNGVRGLFAGFVDQDNKDPDTYIFKIYQGGTGLPDRDMYLVDNEKFAAIRTAYKQYLTDMLALAGEGNAEARANAIFDMEKSIAEVHWKREDSSDSAKTYNKMTLAQLDEAAPALKLSAVLPAISPKIGDVVVYQPSALTGISGIFESTDISVLRDQMLVRTLSAFANYLPNKVSDRQFAFFGTVLQGTPQREERWKRAVSFTEEAVGEEVGKSYAARYFPPETKAAMDQLVKNVLGAMGRRIDSLGWMQPETKVRARAKLANFTTKIGYPDKWKDYSTLEIRHGDLFGNALRTNQWQFEDNMSKLGSPVRRWEWGMLPQEVNAYANFNMNEIVFPAAILQPPFFDPNADPAINYGGIGAVIGHEISHHFDDQGAKYDEHGRLSDWWTESDVKAFEEAGKALIAQYDAYEIFPGANVKGEFTLGENIGDLAGLTIAYDAYHASLGGKEPPVIDGMTGDQRFFLGWAQVWRRNYREANLRNRLITDPHSPSQQRAWVVRNLDKWYDAFQPAEGDKLYLPPEKRVKIW